MIFSLSTNLMSRSKPTISWSTNCCGNFAIPLWQRGTRQKSLQHYHTLIKLKALRVHTDSVSVLDKEWKGKVNHRYICIVTCHESYKHSITPRSNSNLTVNPLFVTYQCFFPEALLPPHTCWVDHFLTLPYLHLSLGFSEPLTVCKLPAHTPKDCDIFVCSHSMNPSVTWIVLSSTSI